jgi:hypothetical protein
MDQALDSLAGSSTGAPSTRGSNAGPRPLPAAFEQSQDDGNYTEEEDSG